MISNSIFSKKVYIETVLGACNRRSLDAQRIATFFRANDCKIVSSPGQADILMLVTCGVSLDREVNSLSRIRSLKKYSGELIVCGCLPAINGQLVSTAHTGRTILTSKLSGIDDQFPDMKVKFSALGDANLYFPSYEGLLDFKFWQMFFAKIRTLRWTSMEYLIKKEIPKFITKTLAKYKVGESAPYSIRISWGCNQKCAYCGIRSAVGKFHSKPMETCLSEFAKGVAEGYQEFEIIADDVGAYGIDIEKTFPGLLNSMFDVQGRYKVRIWNLSPSWFIKHQDEFLSILRKGKICEIHYPIQSGSHPVLKAMNRYHNTAKLKESVIAMKKQQKNLIVTTDIIIGFPGETDEDISETINFLYDAQFDTVYIFLYNDVPNTISYVANGKVPREIALQRINRIQKELENKHLDYLIIV